MTAVEYYVCIASIMCLFVAFAWFVDRRMNTHRYYQQDAQNDGIRSMIEGFRKDGLKAHSIAASVIILFMTGAYLVADGMVQADLMDDFEQGMVAIVGFMTIAFLFIEQARIQVVEEYMRRQYDSTRC